MKHSLQRSRSSSATLAEVPAGPMLLVANEYLDCLPARQFRRDGASWRECVIGLDDKRELVFGLAADEQAAPEGAADASAVVEVQTGMDLLVADLVTRAPVPGPVHRLWPVRYSHRATAFVRTRMVSR
jgi:SAM-dependent MidA family methyltransferase